MCLVEEPGQQGAGDRGDVDAGAQQGHADGGGRATGDRPAEGPADAAVRRVPGPVGRETHARPRDFCLQEDDRERRGQVRPCTDRSAHFTQS